MTGIRRGGAKGEQDVENRTGAADLIVAFGLDPDRPAVGLDDTTGDGQTKAGATALELGLTAGVLQGIAEALELGKDGILVLLGDADAIIGDGDLDEAGQEATIHFDLSAIWGVLDGIDQEVFEGLVEALGVSEEHAISTGKITEGQGLPAVG